MKTVRARDALRSLSIRSRVLGRLLIGVGPCTFSRACRALALSFGQEHVERARQARLAAAHKAGGGRGVAFLAGGAAAMAAGVGGGAHAATGTWAGTGAGAGTGTGSGAAGGAGGAGGAWQVSAPPLAPSSAMAGFIAGAQGDGGLLQAVFSGQQQHSQQQQHACGEHADASLDAASAASEEGRLRAAFCLGPGAPPSLDHPIALWAAKEERVRAPRSRSGSGRSPLTHDSHTK